MSNPNKNIQRGSANLTVRVLSPHSKHCQRDAPFGGKWKIDRDRNHELIPFHRRSFWGDHRGAGWNFMLLRCNSAIDCRASAFVRLEDIEFGVELILEDERKS
jgi:hypothetical protein